VGSGRGRAMRRCSFAGPPPIVDGCLEVLDVGGFVIFPEMCWEAWVVVLVELRTGVYYSST
jgi:hypothetical protein